MDRLCFLSIHYMVDFQQSAYMCVFKFKRVTFTSQWLFRSTLLLLVRKDAIDPFLQRLLLRMLVYREKDKRVLNVRPLAFNFIHIYSRILLFLYYFSQCMWSIMGVNCHKTPPFHYISFNWYIYSFFTGDQNHVKH